MPAAVAMPWLSDAFLRNAGESLVAAGMRPDDALLVWYGESGLKPGAQSPPPERATGLNQILASILAKAGIDADEYRQRSADEQLPVVMRDLKARTAAYGAAFPDAATYAASNFLPARVRRGMGEQDAITSRGEAPYDRNAGLDVDKDGRITLADFRARMKTLRSSAPFQGLMARLHALGVPVGDLRDAGVKNCHAPGTLPKEIIARAHEVLDMNLPYGQSLAEWWNGQWYRFLSEEHPPDKGIPKPHPGVTVFECDGPPPATPAPSSRSSGAGLALALAAVGLGVVLVARRAA